MDLKEKILSDSIYSAVSSGISVFRGIVVIPLITKLLGPAEYGIWTVLLTLVMILKTIGGFHLHGALIRYQRRDQRTEQGYADVLSLTLVIAVLLAVLYLLVLQFFDVGVLVDGAGDADMKILLVVTIALIVFEMIYEINKNFPRAKGNIRLYELVSVSRILAEVVVLSVVFLLGGGLFAGLLSLLLVHVVVNSALMYHIVRSYTIPLPKPSLFSTYLQFGLPMVPKDLSGYILTQSDKYLILFFLSPSAVGIYAVAYSVSSVLERFGTILNPTLYPTVANAWDANKLEEIRSVYASIFRYYTILTIPAFVGISILSKPLLRILSTESIADQGTLIVPLISLAFVLRGYETVIEYILTAAEETYKMAIATGIAAVLNILLNVALIPIFGIGGAALTTLLSQFVFVAMVYRYAVDHVSLPLPRSCLLKTAFSSVVMGLTLLYLPVSVPNIPMLIAYPVIGVAVYFLVMSSIGGISIDELRAAIRAIQ